MGHVAENGEDDKTGEKAGGTVDDAGDQGVSVDIVVELVVAGKGQQHTKAGAQREEDLRGGVHPHRRLVQCVEVRRQVVANAVDGARQHQPPNEENEENNIGK